MFNIGFGEFLIIAIVLIIVVGPDRLPALMRTVGKTIRGVRQASNELRSSVGLDELMNQDLLRQPPRRAEPRRRSEPSDEPASSRRAAQPGDAAEMETKEQESTPPGLQGVSEKSAAKARSAPSAPPEPAPPTGQGTGEKSS